MVQLSRPYMTTGKTIALTRWTCVGKVMSLPFNMLSRFVITFLPRRKCLLILWLQSPSAVILEPKKIKSLSFHCFPVYLPWRDGTKCHNLLFDMLSMLVITFLPRSKHLLISWLQSQSVVIWKPKKIKSLTVSTVSPSIRHEVMGLYAMIVVFWMLSFKPTFSLSSFTFIKRLFSSSSPFCN